MVHLIVALPDDATISRILPYVSQSIVMTHIKRDAKTHSSRQATKVHYLINGKNILTAPFARTLLDILRTNSPTQKKDATCTVGSVLSVAHGCSVNSGMMLLHFKYNLHATVIECDPIRIVAAYPKMETNNH